MRLLIFLILTIFVDDVRGRTLKAESAYDAYTEVFSGADASIKEAHRQMGYDASHAAQSAYEHTQRTIALSALWKGITNKPVSEYERQVVADYAVHLGLNIGLEVGVISVQKIFAALLKTALPKVSITFGKSHQVAAEIHGIKTGVQPVQNSFHSVSGKIKETPITWTSPTGTGQTYKVWQRTDIDWNMVRTNPEGPLSFIGKTNREAALAGKAPELVDNSFATLHHIGQNAKDPLVEASTAHHNFGLAQLPSGKTPFQILHGQFGSKAKHPEFPMSHDAGWNTDRTSYWKWRVENASK